MNKISAGELARMVATVEEAFNDVCTIASMTGSSQDSYAGVSITRSAAVSVDCSFSTKPEYRHERGQVVTLDCDASMRVSLSQAVAVLDSVTFKDKTYEVDGVIVLRTAKVVALKVMAVNEDDDPS